MKSAQRIRIAERLTLFEALRNFVIVQRMCLMEDNPYSEKSLNESLSRVQKSRAFYKAQPVLSNSMQLDLTSLDRQEQWLNKQLEITRRHLTENAQSGVP